MPRTRFERLSKETWDEIKKCPFCGGDAAVYDETHWISGRSNGGYQKYIMCKRCNCRTSSFFWDDRKEMIETWNRREK